MGFFESKAGDQAKNMSIGILAMENLQNTPPAAGLQLAKQELESGIREKFRQASRGDLKALHPMDVYVSYYRKFGYTYHVLPQLESLIKGKGIPSGLPLVEAMFMGELKNMLLTAGHDLDKIQAPLSLEGSTGGESFVALSGKEVKTVAGDYMLVDQASVISSILRGPDLRTAITAQTKRVIYTVYAPCGVEEELLGEHLNDIESYVRLFSEQAITCSKQILGG